MWLSSADDRLKANVCVGRRFDVRCGVSRNGEKMSVSGSDGRDGHWWNPLGRVVI